MDIFSHAFWNIVVAKSANSKIKYFRKKKSVSAVWLAAWGIVPDIFAFAPIFISSAFVFFLGTGETSVFQIPHPSDIEPASGNGMFIFKLTRILYNISHSAIIFAAFFAIAYLIFKRVRWAMLGWLIHILIDIPTHSYQFYPTPVLWPVSSWKFNGISWATPWFLIVDILAIVAISLYWFYRKKNN